MTLAALRHHPLLTATVAALTGVLTMTACGDPTSPPTAESPTSEVPASVPASTTTVDPTVTDRVAILAASARYRVEVDNSFGGGDAGFSEILIVDRIGASQADGGVDLDAGSPVTEQERAAIESALAAHRVGWIGPGVTFDLDNPDHVAVLTLGDPRTIDGRLVVSSQLWCGGTCAILNTHELIPSAAGWELGEVIGATAMA